MTLQVANTIRTQLGANKFEAMTGAKNWIGDAVSVRFDIGRNGSKANKVKITLINDEYRIEFFKYSTPRLDMKTMETKGGLESLKVFEGVQVSNLREVFGAYTKLVLNLF